LRPAAAHESALYSHCCHVESRGRGEAAAASKRNEKLSHTHTPLLSSPLAHYTAAASVKSYSMVGTTAAMNLRKRIR